MYTRGILHGTDSGMIPTHWLWLRKEPGSNNTDGAVSCAWGVPRTAHPKRFPPANGLMSHGRECIQHIANSSTLLMIQPDFSFADAVWEEELMHQRQMAASIAALSPVQRAARHSSLRAADAAQRAATASLMARLATEKATASRFKTEHPLLRQRDIDDGELALRRSWAAEDALWDNPWTQYLEESYHGFFDCSSMPERDYTAMMQWLYKNGFQVAAQSHRGRLRVSWEDLPPRAWKPTHAPKYKPTDGQIQRFCVKCPPGCPADGCKYVHGDVIHRVNFPCKFALTCCGTKRENCLHMHPGETWTPDMVIRRAPAPQVTEPVAPVPVPLPQVPLAPLPQVTLVPEPAYEGAWDAEDFQVPEVKVIAVTEEEMERQEMNKTHQAIQRL